jgi:hypothetical protein
MAEVELSLTRSIIAGEEEDMVVTQIVKRMNENIFIYMSMI